MAMNKKESRLRRAKRTRKQIQRLGMERISVHRTLQHIYAQIIKPDGTVLLSVSSLSKEFGKKYGGNIDAAKQVGQLLAVKALALGIKKVAFDRSGFKYHGRVKALAEAAREGGLDF